MPLVGDGAAGLTQLDPGASAWLAQSNANFLQLNNEQSWASEVTAGEDLVAGTWVYMKSDGKVYAGNWNVAAEYLIIGVALDAIALNDTGKVYHMGRVPLVSGVSVGGRLYLSTGGTVASTSGDSSDTAKRLVMGLQWSSTEVLVTCLGAMNVF